MKKTKAMSSMFHKILITIFALTVIANFANAQLVQEGLVSYWSFIVKPIITWTL